MFIVTDIVVSLRSVYLIGQERSSDRIDLYFIFNELRFVFMRGGGIHGRTSFVIYEEKWTVGNYMYLHVHFTVTQIFSGGEGKINLHTTLKLTVFMRSRRHLVFFNAVTSL